MDQSKPLGAVLVLYGLVAPLAFGQSPLARTQTKPPVNGTRGVIRPQMVVTQPATSTVPSLFGMNRKDVSVRLDPLHLQPIFSGPDNAIAVGQDPSAGTPVKYGSGVAVTLGELPRLVVAVPAPALAGKELTFTVSFEPPLPPGTPVSYRFSWGDGGRIESSANAVVTHQFEDAAKRLVAVQAFVNDRSRIVGRVVVDVIAPLPPADTGPTGTDTSASDTTATLATVDTTSSATTATMATATSVATTDTTPTIDTTPTSTTATATSTTTGTSGGGTSSNLLVWIGAAAVVLLLVVTFLLARVLRALNRKEPQVQAKSNVAFNGGMRSVEYEIEHPELIRRMPEVALRGGIRGEGDGDV